MSHLLCFFHGSVRYILYIQGNNNNNIAQMIQYSCQIYKVHDTISHGIIKKYNNGITNKRRTFLHKNFRQRVCHEFTELIGSFQVTVEFHEVFQ